MELDFNGIEMLLLDVDGVLTDGGIYISEQGVQSKKYNVKDGFGIKMLASHNILTGIISHSLARDMVVARAKMLGIGHYYIGQEPKVEVMRSWSEKLEIPLRKMAYIGDDLNDLEPISAAGIGVCPADAVMAVKERADVILQRGGGQGCVREFIDEYLLKNRDLH